MLHQSVGDRDGDSSELRASNKYEVLAQIFTFQQAEIINIGHIILHKKTATFLSPSPKHSLTMTAHTTPTTNNTMVDDTEQHVQTKKKKATTAKNPTKKSVSFFGVVTVHHVMNIDGYTFDEIDDAWWSKDEYRDMQSDSVAIAQSVRTQNTNNTPLVSFELSDRMELRGLEILIEREQMWDKIDRSLETVLSHFRRDNSNCNCNNYDEKEESDVLDGTTTTTVMTDDDTSYDSSEISATDCGADSGPCQTSSPHHHHQQQKQQQQQQQQPPPSWLTSYSMYSEVAMREARINGLIDELSAIKVQAGHHHHHHHGTTTSSSNDDDEHSFHVQPPLVAWTNTEEHVVTTFTGDLQVDDETDDMSDQGRDVPTTTTTATTVKPSELPVHVVNDITGCDKDENDLISNNTTIVTVAGRSNRSFMIPKLSWVKRLRGSGREDKSTK